MSTSPESIQKKMRQELDTLADPRVSAHIQSLLIEPEPVMRPWDYGEEDQKYECWSVLVESDGNIGIAYSEFGFGPRAPWGLVRMSGDRSKHSMGMDCAWYSSFLDAYFESAASELPIWRVFKRVDGAYPGQPISVEMDWNAAWKEVETLRAADKEAQYNCHHSISYGGDKRQL